MVHGGPESHYSNGWVSNYGSPGQVLSGRGYFVFYPNYRSSTGYGVEFALTGYEDPAGVEFDDIADGIDALIENGFVDKDRVGLGGGIIWWLCGSVVLIVIIQKRLKLFVCEWESAI